MCSAAPHATIYMNARPEGSKNRPKNLTTNSVADFDPGWQPLVN
jgi:hypothetical protein